MRAPFPRFDSIPRDGLVLFAILSAVLSPFLLSACTIGRAGPPLELTILATGDVRGYVDPCG